ncbi:MAG TPA: nuclear transport factor 2 family protein [Chthoniobacterales bacterium]|nr:nuclear transport factor 2 family protein [Chthoniobacterales bacterium]
MNSIARGLHLMLIGILSASALFAAAPARDQENDKTRLRELKEVLWPKAYREQDAALLAQILADEFESIDAQGNISTKAEELDYVRKNKPGYDSFRFVIRRLQIFENRTAVVSGTGHIETKAREGKKASKMEYQSSNVFIERDGRWQAISSHVSGIKPIEG